jgi:hypothetical protein
MGDMTHTKEERREEGNGWGMTRQRGKCMETSQIPRHLSSTDPRTTE